MELGQILDAEIGRLESGVTREVAIQHGSAPKTKVHGDVQGGYAPFLGLAAMATACAVVGLYYASKKLVLWAGKRLKSPASYYYDNV